MWNVELDLADAVTTRLGVHRRRGVVGPVDLQPARRGANFGGPFLVFGHLVEQLFKQQSRPQKRLRLSMHASRYLDHFLHTKHSHRLSRISTTRKQEDWRWRSAILREKEYPDDAVAVHNMGDWLVQCPCPAQNTPAR
jgi:hypothetical protein